MIDFKKLAFSSRYKVDQIIGSYSGSFQTNSGAVYTFFQFNTGIPANVLFRGQISIDGGTTWRNANSSPLVSSVDPIDTTLYSKPGLLNIDYNDQSKTNRTVLYRAVAIARPDQPDFTPQSINTKLFFKSGTNYQKIYQDVVIPLTYTSTSQVIPFSYSHNLGYIPRIMMFIDNGFAIQDLNRYGNTTLAQRIQINASTVNMDIPNGSGTTGTQNVYLRVYYDE